MLRTKDEAATAAVEPPNMAALQDTLLSRIESRSATVGVVGLGYAGLPLAIAFAEAGFRVVGVDLDANRSEKLNRGESYIDDVPSRHVKTLVEIGRLNASHEHAALQDADVVLLCVPTPLAEARRPDLSFVEQAASDVSQVLRRGALVILESTTVPGTTEEVLQPRLEGRGLRAGVDFFLGYAPERVDPGNTKFHMRNTPKLVSGITPESRDLVAALYRTVVDEVVPMSSTRAAEVTKLLENSFRAVNVGFANEMAMICRQLGVDAWEVIDAAATKPFGFMPFYPGPGCGGHCIPVVPFFLSWKMKTLGTTARFIDLSGEVNDAMPAFVVGRVMEALNEIGRPLKGSRVVVLGVTYKPNVADMRESPSLEVLRMLYARGADAAYHDPFVPRVTLTGFGWHGGTGTVIADQDGAHLVQLDAEPLTEALLREADCVVIATNHKQYDWAWIAQHARLVVDTRNAMRDIGPVSARVKVVKI